MQELTSNNVQNILEAAKNFLRRLQTLQISHEIAKRLPNATAATLRKFAFNLKQQDKEISYQHVENSMRETMVTSFIDSRIFEVAERSRIDVYSILERTAKLCAEEIFNASGKDLNNALLFLDFSITLLQLPRHYQQLLL